MISDWLKRYSILFKNYSLLLSIFLVFFKKGIPQGVQGGDFLLSVTVLTHWLREISLYVTEYSFAIIVLIVFSSPSFDPKTGMPKLFFMTSY